MVCGELALVERYGCGVGGVGVVLRVGEVGAFLGEEEGEAEEGEERGGCCWHSKF